MSPAQGENPMILPDSLKYWDPDDGCVTVNEKGLAKLLEAREKAIRKLDWMLAPGQTRKEAVEILRQALATTTQEDGDEV